MAEDGPIKNLNIGFQCGLIKAATGHNSLYKYLSARPVVYAAHISEQQKKSDIRYESSYLRDQNPGHDKLKYWVMTPLDL